MCNERDKIWRSFVVEVAKSGSLGSVAAVFNLRRQQWALCHYDEILHQLKCAAFENDDAMTTSSRDACKEGMTRVAPKGWGLGESFCLDSRWVFVAEDEADEVREGSIVEIKIAPGVRKQGRVMAMFNGGVDAENEASWENDKGPVAFASDGTPCGSEGCCRVDFFDEELNKSPNRTFPVSAVSVPRVIDTGQMGR